MTTTKRITRATIKSFIKKNFEAGNLYAKSESRFDGMTDCVQDSQNQETRKIDSIDMSKEYNFGINGIWLVGQSRDGFYAYENEKYQGFEIYNSCGTSYILKLK
jgi:hypothetical protein